ncbi:DUF3152 domain-containing protein [Modestobacter marinus]|uniref:DUF3152 domain-containing protein n=1 Tax=Modestobacter marinus TaxID=477641 RepID=UPI0027E10675|nr:DUF3152 domain-containing protein [Modestobacter marinus]
MRPAVPAGPVPRRPPPRVAPRDQYGPASGPLARPASRRRRVAEPDGWVRRFVRRHGWRAYAIPLLTVATLLTVADVAATADGGSYKAAPAAGATTATPPGAPSPAGTPAPPPAEGEGLPTATPPSAAPATYVEQGAGSVTVVDGVSPVYGSGPLQKFVVEVEDGIGVDPAGFAAAVEATLGDGRSWGHGGALSFQRVGAAEAAAGDYVFRVSLISPGSMETYCPGVGTGGYTSCRYGERAVINLARWETAVPDYAGDVATYRQYVVNHEVGHALGRGHQPCPGTGEVAPVMQQQTLGLDGCAKNAWPFP